MPEVRENTHTAPLPVPTSCGAPTRAVLPSVDSDTLHPNCPLSISPWPSFWHPLTLQSPTSLLCWVQLLPERVNTQAAPLPWSPGAPTMVVFPSPESATLEPNCPLPASPLPSFAHALPVQFPTRFAPCSQKP